MFGLDYGIHPDMQTNDLEDFQSALRNIKRVQTELHTFSLAHRLK